MKSDKHNISDSSNVNVPSKGPQYWRSLDEVAQTPEFNEWLEREFPAGASEAHGVNRRHFIKIMAASFGLAGFGLAGCRQPERYIMPYSKQPERVIPGVSTYFSSSLPGEKENIPIIVETHENRPTKIEGNPSYTPYGGGSDLFVQASILDLYDPDRARASLRIKDKKELSLPEVYDLLDILNKKYMPKEGAGLAFLVRPSSSPTRERMTAQIKAKMHRAFWVEYSPTDTQTQELALKKLYSQDLRPVFHLDKAKRILAFDSDFLNNEPGSLGYAKDFAASRRVLNSHEASKMARLYVAESQYSLTGGMADHRLRVATHYMPGFIARVASVVVEKTGGPSSLSKALYQQSYGLEFDDQWVQACVEDLLTHPGQSVVIAGAHLPQEAHQMAFIINEHLQAIGQTVDLVELPSVAIKEDLETLIDHIQTGNIQTLVILGGNPAYDMPGLLNWPNLQKQVPEVYYFGTHYNETAALSNVHIAASHYLETWSDGRTLDGTLLPVQPMILPLYKTIGENELLASVTKQPSTDPYRLVLDTFNAIGKGYSFAKWLAEGVLPNSKFPIKNPPVDASRATSEVYAFNLNLTQLGLENLEVRVLPCSKLWDGRYNNNGWLQECPDPMTKLTWDNAILVSPRLALHLEETTGVEIFPSKTLMNKTGQLNSTTNTFERGRENAWVAKLKVKGTTIKGPIFIQPGLADYTLIVNMGYGRTITGRVGEGSGFDVFPILAREDELNLTGATLSLTNKKARLANTQEHWSMEGRAIIREANALDYENHPDFAQKMGMESHSPAVYGTAKNDPLQEKVTQIPRGGSMYKTPAFAGAQQWGMTIDLNTCTGCTACVVACQSENNIPVIGKDQVIYGREMHWIRLDRYYSSGHKDKTQLLEDPQVSFMGMLCQHCELAPCEMVCPVNATVHDEEGLNVMAYNRCVGTRYCSNNCPYKVRRFNFFDWNKRQTDHLYQGPLGPAGMADTLQMQKNPDVTVRMRGVMEKCTFCVQRIEEAKITQRNKAKNSDNVKVPDGAIQTACQQACPTDSIVFGDIADPTTEVYKLKHVDRNYSVLGYLNTRPRISYLARVRNPNPRMPDYKDQPLSRFEYETRYGHQSHHSAAPVHH